MSNYVTIMVGQPGIILNIVCGILFSASVSGSDVEISSATFPFDYPPYQVVKDGQPAGPDADLIREFMGRIEGHSIRFEIRPTGRVVHDMAAGEIDTGVGFRSKEVEPYVLFAKYPLHHSEYRIYTLKSGNGIESIADLRSLTIGVVLGHTLNPEFERYVGKNNIKLKTIPNFETLLLMIRSGRIDALISNTNIVEYYSKKWDLEGQLQMSPVKVGEINPFYFGISKNTKTVDPQWLLSEVNKAMESMRSDGTWQAILDKYYGAGSAGFNSGLEKLQ